MPDSDPASGSFLLRKSGRTRSRIGALRDDGTEHGMTVLLPSGHPDNLLVRIPVFSPFTVMPDTDPASGSFLLIKSKNEIPYRSTTG
jgi:hypothetical protein